MKPHLFRAAWKAHGGKFHKVAQALGVNPKHVYNLVRYDKEPTSKEVRAKMGFRPRKSRAGQEIPEHWRWWRHQPAEVRNEIVRQLWASKH